MAEDRGVRGAGGPAGAVVGTAEPVVGIGGPHPTGAHPDREGPTLGGGARSSTSGQYRATVRRALDQSGFADLVQRGYWVLDELDRGDRTAAALVSLMGVTKQAVSQLIDQLVGQDYVERLPDPLDGRRTLLRPTARGRAAATVVQRAVAAVERDAAARIGAAEVVSLASSLRRFVGDSDPVPAADPTPSPRSPDQPG
jgi:DNA-binding MarR family transcriptional regulator